MIYRTLNYKEQQAVLAIKRDNLSDTINARKNYINTIIVDWIKTIPNFRGVWIAAYPQYGKMYINKELFSRMYIKNPNIKITGIFPETRLAEDAKKFHDSRMTSLVVNSAEKYYQKSDVLLLDEGQYYLNDTKRNSKVLDFDYKYLIINAAFLEKDHINILESYGINHCFEIPEEMGFKLGIIPEFKSYNIPVEFTSQEKKEYYAIQKNFKDYVDLIYPFYGKRSAGILMQLSGNKKLVKDVAELLGYSEGQVYGIAAKYTKAVTARKNLLKSATNKFFLAKKIADKNSSKKGIFFVDTQKNAIKLKKLLGKSAVIYTSKTSEKTLNDFREGIYKQIIVINKSDVGAVDNELEYGVHLSIIGKPLRSKQRKSRIQTVDINNPNKEPINYYLFINHFTMFGEEVFSQDVKWLEDTQKTQMNVYLKDIDDIFESNI